MRRESVYPDPPLTSTANQEHRVEDLPRRSSAFNNATMIEASQDNTLLLDEDDEDITEILKPSLAMPTSTSGRSAVLSGAQAPAIQFQPEPFAFSVRTVEGQLPAVTSENTQYRGQLPINNSFALLTRCLQETGTSVPSSYFSEIIQEWGRKHHF